LKAIVYEKYGPPDVLQLIQASFQGRRNSTTGGQKSYVVSLVQSQKDLLLMKELLESGKVVAVIDGCYPLSKTADAFRYYEEVHPKGKVIITMG
jgi:NADPH:quinone reductase-like Zn-dependent oxidoreductase